MKNYYNQKKDLEIAEIRLENLEERLQRLEATIISCTSQTEEMMGSGGFSNDKMDQYIIKKTILENDIAIQKEEIKNLKKDLKRMEHAIRQMKGIEEKIFILLHVECHKPAEVARLIPCDLSTVYRYRDKINNRIESCEKMRKI